MVKTIFLDQDGHLLTTNNLPKVLLDIDQYAFKMYKFLKKRNDNNRRSLPSYTQISQSVGYSTSKVKDVLETFKNLNLFPKLIR